MSERDGYIPGVPCWIDSAHPDPRRAARFYGALFGWEFENVMPEGSDAVYLMARIRGGDVAAISSTPDGARPARWNTYVEVASADEAAAKAVDAGGSVTVAPFDVMDAGRMAVLADAEGAEVCVWEPRRHRGAKVVNEHGSLNFNGLATRDLEGAATFYGAVFGWKTLTLPSGIAWALPGYGDHLEERTPGLRGQMAGMGAPDGFIDVVATVEPIATGDAVTVPHWSVTFAVDDVDATVATVRELGGTVVSGPADGPWTRSAVVDDPQGARFVASQFVPENKDLVAEAR